MIKLRYYVAIFWIIFAVISFVLGYFATQLINQIGFYVAGWSGLVISNCWSASQCN